MPLNLRCVKIEYKTISKSEINKAEELPVGIAFSLLLSFYDSSDGPNPVVVVVLIWGPFFGIWLLWNKVRESRDEDLIVRSLSWPEVQGVVLTSRLRWAHVEANYEYTTGGQRYVGWHKVGVSPVLPGAGFIGARRFSNESNQLMEIIPRGQKSSFATTL
jgi:hypothetical protein